MKLADRYRNLEDPLQTERRVELVLIVFALLLALQLLWGGFRVLFPSVPEPVQPRPNSLLVVPIEAGGQIDPELRAQIAARPLFWESRRPLEPQAEAQAVAETESQAAAQRPGKIDGINLKGVFGGGDTAGIIVLFEGKKRRVMVGEEIKGWKLRSVEPSLAIFSSDGREARLVLKQGTIQVSQVAAEAARDTSPKSTEKAAGQPEQGAAGKAATPAEDRGTLTLGGRPHRNET